MKSFRDHLVAATLNAYFIKNNIDQPLFLQDEGNACMNPSFSWGAQDQWNCNCPKGMQQSPVEIENDAAVKVEEEYLRFNLLSAKMVRYNVVRGEPEFYANWGSFSFLQPQKNTRFQINKISFKVTKAEHKLEGQGVPVGEMLLWGESPEMTKASLSILFLKTDSDLFDAEDAKGQNRKNRFMEAMNINNWKFTNINEVDSDNKPILKCLEFQDDPHRRA